MEPAQTRPGAFPRPSACVSSALPARAARPRSAGGARRSPRTSQPDDAEPPPMRGRRRSGRTASRAERAVTRVSSPPASVGTRIARDGGPSLLAPIDTCGRRLDSARTTHSRPDTTRARFACARTRSSARHSREQHESRRSLSMRAASRRSCAGRRASFRFADTKSRDAWRNGPLRPSQCGCTHATAARIRCGLARARGTSIH